MIKKYLTCERYLEHYNKGEKTVVGRLDTPEHICVVETDMEQEVVFYDNNGTKMPRGMNRYLVGPIADTLHAYEELGYSPEELKEIIEENKKLKEITTKVGEDKFTLRYEHTTSPIGSVTTINLPDPKKDPITEVRNMAQMDQYFEDRNIKVVRKYDKKYSRYTFTLSYAGVSRDYHFTYPMGDEYAEKCKKMTKFCEGAYECFDKEVRSQVHVTYMPSRGNGKSLLAAKHMFDYIEQDITIQKKLYDMLNPANRISIEDLYPSTMIYPRPSTPVIKDVIFNDPATIVFWKDGTKTVVKAQGEAFDPEKGLAMAFSKKMFGNDHDYYIQFLRWLKKAKKGAERKNLEVKED